MLNHLCRHNFCDFVKIPQKFLALPLLEITTLEYQIIGEFGIIRGLETFPKINNRKGVGVMAGGKKMTGKRFWYQYNKGRTKYCHILKAQKFSQMMYNYMDINSSLMLNFFRFLCVF